MSYAETRQRILRMLPKGAIGAEIGVWQGDYSEKLLDITSPRVLHLIDPWAVRIDPLYDAAWYCKARGADMEATYQGVRARFSREIASGQVVIHRKLSNEAMGDLADSSLDYVYVDG
ncbi:MAG: class I SAM-dependent methyltransferase, partial [Pseudomonadota bacterium]